MSGQLPPKPLQLPEAGRPGSPVEKEQDGQDGSQTFPGAAAPHAKPEGHGATLFL